MGRYEKISVVGEGQYGLVMKCRHRETGEVVALKRFDMSAADDEASRRSMRREVNILKALKHDNIVEMKEAFRRKGTLYIVFELAEQSVMDLLEANADGLAANVVRRFTCQLACALEHCHRNGVIHRDVKPENLLVAEGNVLRLCDFGCARKYPSEPDVVLTDYIATRWYRAPELLLSTNNYSMSIDIWSLGCIMAELTVGRPLFAGESDVDQLCVIQKCLGPLTSEQMQRSMELSSFQGLEFPTVVEAQTLESRFSSQMSPMQLDWLASTAAMNPVARLSAKTAAQAAWLKGAVPERNPKGAEGSKGRGALAPKSEGGNMTSRVASAGDGVPAVAATPRGGYSGMGLGVSAQVSHTDDESTDIPSSRRVGEGPFSRGTSPGAPTGAMELLGDSAGLAKSPRGAANSAAPRGTERGKIQSKPGSAPSSESGEASEDPFSKYTSAAVASAAKVKLKTSRWDGA